MKVLIKTYTDSKNKINFLIFFLLALMIQTLSSSQIQIGSNINGEAPYDLSGFAVAVNATGNIMVVGAKLNDAGSDNTSGNKNYGLAMVLKFIGSS